MKHNPALPNDIGELADLYESMKSKTQTLMEGKKVVFEPGTPSDGNKIREFLKKDEIKFKDVQKTIVAEFKDDLQKAVSMSALKKDVGAKFEILKESTLVNVDDLSKLPILVQKTLKDLGINDSYISKIEDTPSKLLIHTNWKKLDHNDIVILAKVKIGISTERNYISFEISK